MNTPGANQKPQAAGRLGNGKMLFFSSLAASAPPTPLPGAAPSATVATLSITVTPPDAMITVDGVVVPAVSTTTVAPGQKRTVSVGITKAGFQPFGNFVEIVGGKTTPLSVTLTPVIAAPPPATTAANGGKRRSRKGDVEMVIIPEGEFVMGSDRDDEQPRRKVYLDAYAIGVNPVTVGQFKAYCADVGIDFDTFPTPAWGWKDAHPMVNVTWQQARDYCRWAGGDLPTEAQWEKAARGTDGREYPWGNAFDAARLWRSKAVEGDANSTTAVGRFPSGPATGPGCVLRGGGWDYNNPENFRSAYRASNDPTSQDPSYGFRLAGPP